MSSVSSIVLDHYQKTIRVNQWDTIYGSVRPITATNQCVWYKSSKPNVVHVESETGCIHGLKPGSAVITVYSDENSSIQSYCEVNVEEAIPVSSISLNKSRLTLRVSEYNSDLCVTVLPTNATNKNVTFTSSDPNVAKVYFDGSIKAFSEGYTQIKAISVDGSFTAQCLVHVEPLLIYRSENTYRNDGNGNLPEDLDCNDICKEDLIDIMRDSKEDLVSKNANDLRTIWENMCTSKFATEPLQTVVLDMIRHFMGGTGADYSNDVLTEKVFEHKDTERYYDTAVECIKSLLSTYNGNITYLKYSTSSRESNPLVIKMREEKNFEPVFDTALDKVTGLTICLDSLWGNMIRVKEYNYDGQNYSGKLEFILYDHFGLDTNDVDKYGFFKGFCAWYILQHNKDFNGSYRPFVTIINFEVPFSGTT